VIFQVYIPLIRCKEWIERRCNPELKHLLIQQITESKKKVCVDHFEPHQFYDHRKIRLKQDKIPQWNGKPSFLAFKSFSQMLTIFQRFFSVLCCLLANFLNVPFYKYFLSTLQ